MAALLPTLIRSQGWSGWPSSMALGGAAGLPQTLAFLALAAVYPVFALRAVRPALGNRAAWGGFIGVAVGDLLLAFPTDAPGAELSSHGLVHLTGVLVVGAATLVAAAGVTLATWSDPSWRPWRIVGVPLVVVATSIGLAAGFDQAWAKVVFVGGITLPVPILAVLLRRQGFNGVLRRPLVADRPCRPARACPSLHTLRGPVGASPIEPCGELGWPPVSLRRRTP